MAAPKKEEQKNGKENRPAGIQGNAAPPADSHAHRKGGAQSNAEYGATGPVQKDLCRIDRLDRHKNQHKRTAAGRILFPEKEKVQQGAEDGKQKGVRNAHGNGAVDRFHRKNAGQKENAGCGKDHAEAEKIRPVKGKHDRKQKREQGKEQKAPYIHAGYYAAQDSGQIQDKKKSGKRRRIKPTGAQAQDPTASGKGQQNTAHRKGIEKRHEADAEDGGQDHIDCRNIEKKGEQSAVKAIGHGNPLGRDAQTASDG